LKRMMNTRLSVWLMITLLMLALFTAPLLAKEQPGLETESQVLSEEHDIARSSERIVRFAGRQWAVKSGCELGPGPNCWSDSEQSVWVDESGQLHLKIREIDGTWYSAEVYTTACTHYGMHRFFVIGPLGDLDKNVVAALFLYQDDQTEMDIEFAKGGEETPAYNAQYVVQPSSTPGNLEPFSMTSSITLTTHYIDWTASSIHFKSIQGHYQEPPDSSHLIHEWWYSGSDTPAEAECLRIHMNLWSHQGNPPSDGQEAEIIVKDAQLPEKIYLPIVYKNYEPPRITVTVTEDGYHAEGEVGPSRFCNANYKVALYAKRDIWYVQPYDDPRRDIPIDPVTCHWEAEIAEWDQVAAHLVLASYDHPSQIRTKECCPPAPLDPGTNSNVLAASCYPATYPDPCRSWATTERLCSRNSPPD
jgi:hypothetical protein